MILLDASGLRASRPGRTLFDEASVTLSTGDRIGLVGLNGCGKSTLLRILSGALEPEAGTVRAYGPPASHHLRWLASANCLLEIPEATAELAAGEHVDVWDLS